MDFPPQLPVGAIDPVIGILGAARIAGIEIGIDLMGGIHREGSGRRGRTAVVPKGGIHAGPRTIITADACGLVRNVNNVKRIIYTCRA